MEQIGHQETSDGSAPATSVHLLHAVMRFYRIVRLRWTLLAAAILFVSFLGILYFATTDRIYQARAQLLVQQTGPIVASANTTERVSQQGMLPTYERLFTSTVVLEGAIARLAEMPRPLRVDLINTPEENRVDRLRGSISARSLRLTNVIEIAYTSASPEAAEAVVGSVVESYMRFMKSNHQTVAEELVGILRSERAEVEKQLALKERFLIQAKREFGDIGLQNAKQTLHPLVQRVVKINESLILVQENRLRLQASLAAVKTAIQRGDDLRQHLFGVEPVVGREVILAALGLSEQDEVAVARLEQKLLDDRSQLDSIQAHYGARHPEVVRLADSVQRTKVYLANYQQSVDRRAERLQRRELGEMLSNLISQELQRAMTQEQVLERQYHAAQAEAVQLQGRFEEIAMMQREVDRLLNFSHTLMNQIDSIDINQNQTDVRVEMVSRPQANRKPVAPNALIVVVVSVLGGLVAGAGLVYVVDVFDDRFRTLDEMKLQLQTPILAMVRQLEQSMETGLDALQVSVAPDAVESEAFRTLRTTLAFSADELDCVAISSSEPGDGKTTIVANLGVAFAQAGRRTLMIDADLRRPGLTRLFEMKGQRGLCELLRADEELTGNLKTSIYPSGQDGLDIIPSGARPLDPTGLLTGSRFAEVLSWAAGHYDQILIDSPPILVASDAAVVGRIARGLMLVVQPEKNHRRLVLRAIEEARSIGLNLVGVIVNKLSPESGQTYYGGGYGYGYGYGREYHDASEDDSPNLAIDGDVNAEDEEGWQTVSDEATSESTTTSSDSISVWPRRVRRAG